MSGPNQVQLTLKRSCKRKYLDEDVDEDDATFHPPEWFTTPVVFRPVVCPTRSGISFYATFKHKDDDVLVLAWRSSSWSEDEAFHTYRGKVSQSLIQLLGDPNGSDLRERVKKEFCDARQLGGYKEGNHDRDLPHDKEAIYQLDQRDIEDSSASTPSHTPLATGSIKIKHAADFPDNVTTASNAKLTLGRRAKAKDTLWTRDLALDEDGHVVNTVSGERFTLGLVAPKQEDKCMTFDVPGIEKYKKLLKLSRNKLHKKLGFVSTADQKKHGGERQYLQAKAHDNHTLNTQLPVSCLHKNNLGPVVQHDDWKLAQIICKSTQPEWKAPVSKPTFTCVGCGKDCKVAAGYSNEVVFQREAVARVAKKLLKEGEQVNGLMAILACCSFKAKMPSTGQPNLALKCSACKNKHAKKTKIEHFRENIIM